MNYDKKFGIGLKFALNGIWCGFRQRNFVVQSVAALMAVVAGLVFRISTVEWCVVLLCIAGTLSLELVNSVVELIVDRISPEYSVFAKQAKDMAAGAVLIGAAASAIIGIIIFLPKFIELCR